MSIKVSVIGLSYNGINLIPPFIESIYCSSLKKKEVEIIIVDNVSIDGTVEFLRKNYPNVKLITQKTNIGSGALNDALDIARGEYLFFTDSDMKFDKFCLENFYSTAKDMGKHTLLSPTLYDYYDKEKLLSSYSVISRSFYSAFVNPEYMDLTLKEVAMAGFVFLHKDTAKKLRYIFDNDYFLYAEDFDLCLRIRLQGFKLYTCPSAVMYNKPPSQTTNKYISQVKLTYYLERNLLLTFFKICSLKTIILYSPYVVVMRLFALLRDLLKGDLKVFTTRIRAYLWILTHIRLVMKKRKMTQKTRKVDDKLIFSIVNDIYFIKSNLGFFKKKQ